MEKREDCRAKALRSLREEQGRNQHLYPEKYEDLAEKHIGPRTSTKTGMAEPKLENVLLNTDFVLFFVMVAELVGRHSMARRLLGDHQWHDNSLENYQW